MHTRALHAELIGLAQHREQMLDVRVHVAVGQQTDEVQGRPLRDHAIDQRAPSVAFEQGAGLDRDVDELRALIERAPGTECVVPNFAVTHVRVRRHADRSAVCGEQRHGGLPRE